MLEWNAHSNTNTELALRARTQVQTGHLDGKKDALLGSFNTRNVYENKLSYPDACYGVDAVECDLDAEDGEQEAGAPPGGVALLSLPLQLPSLCAVSGNAFKDDGDLRAPYDNTMPSFTQRDYPRFEISSWVVQIPKTLSRPWLQIGTMTVLMIS